MYKTVKKVGLAGASGFGIFMFYITIVIFFNLELIADRLGLSVGKVEYNAYAMLLISMILAAAPVYYYWHSLNRTRSEE